MIDWQPIETAPKDGTRVLLAIFREDPQWQERWSGRESDFYHLARFNGSYWDPYVPCDWTNWVPLPEPLR